MPALALIEFRGPRRLPALPVPMFLLWPFVAICAGIAWILERDRPADAAKLRTAVHVFNALRGLEIDFDSRDRMRVRIRFV